MAHCVWIAVQLAATEIPTEAAVLSCELTVGGPDADARRLGGVGGRWADRPGGPLQVGAVVDGQKGVLLTGLR